MKQTIKKTAVKLFDPVAKKLGYQTASVNNEANEKTPLLINFYSILKQIEFSPKHIVDIGANHGTWTRMALVFFPDAFYTLIEPQGWLKDSIKDLTENNTKIKFHAVGAGAKPGIFKFTIADRDDSCSFKFTETEAKLSGFKQIDIPVVTLNELLAEADLPDPDIIKIDAEGLDLEVLKGADNYFGKTEIFLVEVAVVLKEFENSFLKMINFMDSKGYNLFDITDLNRPFATKILWLAELVFVKKGGFIDSQKFV
jgi:FkbM family methyltransferase